MSCTAGINCLADLRHRRERPRRRSPESRFSPFSSSSLTASCSSRHAAKLSAALKPTSLLKNRSPAAGKTLRCAREATPLESDTTSQFLDEVLQVAVKVAVAGGAVVREKVGADVIKTKANPRDLLTEVDGEVQQLIEAQVRTFFPEHGFLGEESVPPGALASAAAIDSLLTSGPEWLWIVDPIDGTTNFVHGMPMSAISIGVSFRGEVVAAVILDPFREECFSARLGGGAFLNGKEIRVGEQTSAGEAVVATGYAPNPAAAGPLLRGMTALATLPVRSMRMLGSAAVMFAWVACGRLTAYFEADLSCWDIAGGALLVKEAGGLITDLDGSQYTLRTRAVLASNNCTHNELIGALQEANCTGLDS
ncbi:hypothetical protein CYMTET_22858 [Cymbomonas tetramitiformis]|uniref:Inositol-1-monophosphatase n=1 Tax=Cymbomonas tetramitiformis TaxID=36881 RepID=A0AAE0FZX0_9CHLO|nr:hypothetical protein CYMTET_22858 [Cymbomonas tetramitiformis]